MLDQELDGVLQALADPHRRRIVERLVRGPATVTELATPLPMSLQAAMQHLAVLETCGLVQSQKVGRVRTCQVETGPLRDVEAWFTRQRTFWDHRLDALERELDPSPAPSPPAPSPPQEGNTP